MPATRALAAALALGALAAGCGAVDRPPISLACTDSRAALARALHAAPAPVRLKDGTRLSQCVTNAQGEGELQDFGVLVTQVADDLAARARAHDDRRAALELGYLVGAARRGAATTGGIHAELVHRLEATARQVVLAGRAATAAYERGERAGERTG